MTVASPNTELLRRIAEHLGPLVEQVVFVGGTTTALLLTDPAAAQVRLTDDVDVLAGTRSLADYYAFAAELRKRGFKEDEGGPVCRWVIDNLTLDVMPPDPRLLGFSNRWYEEALSKFTVESVAPGVNVRVITAPYFLATKLEAFHGRGKGDTLASHDLEDIITVVDGRPEIVDEVRADTSPDVRQYLLAEVTALLESDQFDRAVSGHLPPDASNQERTEKVLERLRAIAAVTEE
jgi:hypothetical protein